MYRELLEYDNIVYLNHVSRFTERLRAAIPGLEKRFVNKKTLVFFSSQVDIILQEEITPTSFMKSLMKVISPIRKDMLEVTNSFKGEFPQDCQENDVPIRLLSLCSVLVDGCDPQEKGFSQSSLTTAQLIMYNFKKNSKTVTSTRKKHARSRETSLPIYVGLKMYATVRSKTLINRLFHLGICISYSRCLEICNLMALSLLEKYDQDKVFVANSLKLHLFTVIAKDNIDMNASCTKIKQHFHGISMTTMQFPTSLSRGILQDTLYGFGTDNTERKLKIPDEYVCLKELPFESNTPLFAPTCTWNIEDNILATNEYDSNKIQEISWLEGVSEANINNCKSWSKFHLNPEEDVLVGINSLMPLINQKISSLKSQFHCMNIIRDTIEFINPNQVPVDVSDQPVYAFSKEVQLRYPSVFGPGKYISLFGDLHVEHSALLMHGQIIKGSGLDSILQRSQLSTIGTSSLVDANDIKRSRYCLQVALCSIYRLLKNAHGESNSTSSPLQWLEERCKVSEMCYYWKMIFDFQITILLFVRSIREGNFQLYIQTFYQLLWWYFVLDRYNYARWATVYYFDLASLHLTCPDVFQEFMKGHFSFLKTKSAFSRMALDQLQEQNNKHIKGVSGATNLVNRQDNSALTRWELCGPELSRILMEFEEGIDNPEEEIGIMKIMLHFRGISLLM